MKTKVFIGTSLDGFIARKNGNFEWLSRFANEEVVNDYKEFLKGIDAILIGRNTYETVIRFAEWPYEQKVFVVSKSIKQVPEKLRKNVTVLAMEPAEILHYLSAEGFSDIYVDGGKLIQSFLKKDLIDEIAISKAPVLIGNGIPLFADLDIDLQFKHIKTHVYSNGLVRSYYERMSK